VTRPRAADDFPLIRARMEELRRERVRPRAADDFATIRARMEELRRERPRTAFETVPLSPKPRHRSWDRVTRYTSRPPQKKIRTPPVSILYRRSSLMYRRPRGAPVVSAAS
jgi:hypothetical protein